MRLRTLYDSLPADCKIRPYADDLPRLMYFHESKERFGYQRGLNTQNWQRYKGNWLWWIGDFEKDIKQDISHYLINPPPDALVHPSCIGALRVVNVKVFNVADRSTRSMYVSRTSAGWQNMFFQERIEANPNISTNEFIVSEEHVPALYESHYDQAVRLTDGFNRWLAQDYDKEVRYNHPSEAHCDVILAEYLTLDAARYFPYRDPGLGEDLEPLPVLIDTEIRHMVEAIAMRSLGKLESEGATEQSTAVVPLKSSTYYLPGAALEEIIRLHFNRKVYTLTEHTGWQRGGSYKVSMVPTVPYYVDPKRDSIDTILTKLVLKGLFPGGDYVISVD